MTLEQSFQTLTTQLQSNAGELASLREAIIELNARSPVIVRLDDRRYTPGDVVPSMNNAERVALDQLLGIVDPAERMLALDNVITHWISGRRRETLLHNRWVLLSGAVILVAAVVGMLLQVWDHLHKT